MKSSKNNLNKSNDLSSVKLNLIERTLFKRLYTTLEKSLIASYQIYNQAMKNYHNDQVMSYQEFCELVNKKLKGDY